MTKISHVAWFVVLLAIAGVAPAAAQRLPFERAFDVSGPVSLDVSTIRGKIDVLSGGDGRVVVTGTVTVRVGLMLPADALEIARRIAASPPIEHDGTTVRLRPPSEAAAQRAVTVAYQVRVPAATTVSTSSDSGATTVSGISGPVTVRTQSAAIDLSSLGGAVTVTTQSGDVKAGLTGMGDVDVKTGSSAIRLSGVRGAATVASQSGRITIDGTPGRDWALTTGSSRIEVTLDAGTAARLDATSRSSDVRVTHPSFKGTTSKGRALGTIGTGGPGGPVVRFESRSGQITIGPRSGA